MGWAQACKALYARTCEKSSATTDIVTSNGTQPSQEQQPSQHKPSTVTPRAAPVRQNSKPVAAQPAFVSPYAGFLIPALTAEDEEAASQLLGMSADADCTDGRKWGRKRVG